MNVNKKEYTGLDYFRIIAAFLIVAIHTSPLSSMSETADFVLTRIIARVAVPFFFMVTGFFLFPQYIRTNTTDKDNIKKFFIKTCKLYGITILLYLPINIYAGYFNNSELFLKLLKDVVFNGTLYHLWYLPASIMGVGVVYILTQKLKNKSVLIIVSALYMIGLFGDSYYGMIRQLPVFKAFYTVFFTLFDYTRNGLFYAPIFLFMGAMTAQRNKEYKTNICVAGFLISTALLLIEGLILHSYSVQRHDSMYFMLIPCMFFLFQLLLLWKGKGNKNIRTMSMIIYVVHPLGIILVRGSAKVTELHDLLIENSIIHYIAVCLVSIGFAVIVILLQTRIRPKRPFPKSRAWIEVNLDNVCHNAKVLQNILPQGCQLMAVVKANAYGHGDAAVSKALNKIGVSAFAVATLSEGINLRKKDIKGDILILGYTHSKDFIYLVRYRLMQTVFDYDYAKNLDNYGKRIKVHLKIDTGMHRLGENYDNIADIEKIFQCKNLMIDGVYTHLSVSDSLNKPDIDFSLSQIENFYNTVDQIKKLGYNPHKLHIQSSYGVLNYPELHCDYARVGISLYGVLSHEEDKTRISVDLQPALSVKARIVMTKNILEGETVSYGRQFTASKNMKIAVVSIGYADGIPRSLSCGNGFVIVGGKRTPILGRVCMDQFMIDITDIPNVNQDDIVTIIGQEGNERVTPEEVAKMAGTITNELLSRLGNRLVRIYV